MKILSYELKKGFTDKTILFFVMIIVIMNIAGIYVNEVSTFEYGDNIAVIKKIDNDLMVMTDETAIAYLTERIDICRILVSMYVYKDIPDSKVYKMSLQSLKTKYPSYDIEYILSNINPLEYSIYTHDITTEINLLDTKLKEVQNTYGYNNYLGAIILKAQEISDTSLFQTSEFTKRNSQKTLDDYVSLDVKKVEYNSSKGIICATSNRITLILSVLMVMFICIQVFVKDKENNTIELLKTMKYGRVRLITAKAVTLFLMVIAAGVLLNLSSLFVSSLIYGLGDLSAPIQSVTGFMTSTYGITVLQYILIFNVYNIMTLALTGLLMLLIFILFKKALYGYIGILVFFGLSITLNMVIDPVSSLNIFKYINIYNFLDSSGIIGRYLNINIFGFPISLSDIFRVSLIIGTSVALTACIKVFSVQKIKPESRGLNRINIGGKIEAKAKTGILRYELYKSFVINPALLILLFVLILQITSANGSDMRFADIDSVYYEYYMDILKGPISEDKTEYLNKELSRVKEEQLISTDPNKTYINQIKVLNTLIEKDMQLNKIFDEKGDNINKEKISFVYELGYERLLLTNSDILLLSMITAILVILCMVNIFVIEYRENTYNIINVTKYGRQRTFWYKIGIKISMVIMIITITYVPYVIRIMKNYGLTCLDAPIISMNSFSTLSINTSILEYIILVFLMKILGLILAGILIAFLAVKLKSFIVTAVVSTFIIVIPSFLAYIGLDVFEKLGFNPFLLGNNLISSINDIYPYALTTLLVCVTLFILLYIDYNRISTKAFR
ncbi:MAG: ABC-2 family transporter protein [Firmicutes bacterium ADurb.Bin146]|nr:MAG: ABC-2 family transporter protein [Firmicutes bacterium ADurb.Bin146]